MIHLGVPNANSCSNFDVKSGLRLRYKRLHEELHTQGTRGHWLDWTWEETKTENFLTSNHGNNYQINLDNLEYIRFTQSTCTLSIPDILQRGREGRGWVWSRDLTILIGLMLIVISIRPIRMVRSLLHTHPLPLPSLPLMTPVSSVHNS